MEQSEFGFDTASDRRVPTKPLAKKSKGPPNRMNDLSYSEWMKFQKSFFRHRSFRDLVEECIYFFTKAMWDDGTYSSCLIVGFPDFPVSTVPGPRKIVTVEDHFPTYIDRLESLCKRKQRFDFVIMNLLDIDLREDTHLELRNDLDRLFNSLRTLVRAEKYCSIVSNSINGSATSFPVPWLVSYHARDFLRLRDEKIGLMTDTNRVYYTLFFQNIPEERHSVSISPGSVVMAKGRVAIPTWIIPKPPPRKKGELLHPAKFPETLVEEFVSMFTGEGDSVFDPMVGTGSAVLAAARIGRNGYGMDLSGRFIEIAKERLEEQFPITFLAEDMHRRPKYDLAQGDATRLDELAAFGQMKFHYCITSPPYWSMLRNFGSEYQRSRRKKALPLFYSDDSRDLGNIGDYDEFMEALVRVYDSIASRLVERGYLTIIVKNVKRNHIVYPLAWDLVSRLCRPEGLYSYIGNTFWCQDDIPMKPFAVGIHWVSNTVHQYCLHFQKKE